MYDVSFLDNLKILDLEGNNVREIEALYSLGNCRHLESLTLGLNPISKEPNYERVTWETLPALKYLDDERILNIEDLDEIAIQQVEDAGKLKE